MVNSSGDEFQELKVADTFAHKGANKEEPTTFKMTAVCPPEMRKELRIAFDSVDDDRSGSISADELYKLFNNFRVDIDEDETEELLQNLDMDGNGEIDFDEFVEIMMSAMEDEDEMIEASFKEFDVDNDGFIQVNELRYVLQYLGENGISERDMKKMIKNADYDGDGKVDLEDFRRLWKEH
ncbi:uncharacterized protein LOC134839257 [Symsagittifera roscoffensis]|uniref:uncharacterized protein LOC134839257 n=1 Tax=Symsagittifera roscoffensis TaxID=84072 RepID=UPI00307C6F28